MIDFEVTVFLNQKPVGTWKSAAIGRSLRIPVPAKRIKVTALYGIRHFVVDHPDELAMEVITAALRHGWITPAQAIAIVRDGRFSFRRTVRVLAAFGDRRGWQPRELVLEALEGQPH